MSWKTSVAAGRTPHKARPFPPKSCCGISSHGEMDAARPKTVTSYPRLPRPRLAAFRRAGHAKRRLPKLGVSRKTLSAILNGQAGISPKMAIRLSIAMVLGTPRPNVVSDHVVSGVTRGGNCGPGLDGWRSTTISRQSEILQPTNPAPAWSADPVG